MPRQDNRDSDKRLVFVAIHNWSDKQRMTKLDLSKADLVKPLLPITEMPVDGRKGYSFENYNFNGWVYNFEEGDYTIVIGSCPALAQSSSKRIDDCDFLFRVRSQHITETNSDNHSLAEFELSNFE